MSVEEKDWERTGEIVMAGHAGGAKSIVERTLTPHRTMIRINEQGANSRAE